LILSVAYWISVDEPGGDDILGHYDIRYFKGVVTYEERTDTLSHMVRAYLNMFRETGMETWIAHGTLLGWWWNGKMLPWDWDLDTQVSGSTLDYMAKHYNRTMHHYVSADGAVSRDYLLDVNPWHWQRDRGDGMNIIDARWIDVRNGLYIDITGLSEVKPEENPGIWSCKNFHNYKTSDLYPMRETMYEGVVAKVPYSYDQILLEEYQSKALVLTEYEG
jgi:LicD family